MTEAETGIPNKPSITPMIRYFKSEKCRLKPMDVNWAFPIDKLGRCFKAAKISSLAPNLVFWDNPLAERIVKGSLK